MTSSVSSPIINLGTGDDTVMLLLSEDAWEGNAMVSIAVDGVQVGGVQTLTASHAAGQDQVFDVLGDWGSGTHVVTVDFLNDAWGGSAAEDRNAYVDGITYNGVVASPDTAALHVDGPVNFSVGSGPEAVQVGTGTGSDTLDLKISEDAWQGNALFTIAVDGVRVGGTFTALASHAAGQDEDFLIAGSFAPGPHQVSVDFLNDAWGGSAATDRNLYVDSIIFDGSVDQGVSLALHNSGTQSATFTKPAVASTNFPASIIVGSGSQTLDLAMSEDAWQGDAQFTVQVDGVQVGGTLTAQASEALGQSQDFLVEGNWTAGMHAVTVTFLNDAWGGSAATDRNLYLDQISTNGVVQLGDAAQNHAGGLSVGTAAALDLDGSATMETAIGVAEPNSMGFAANDDISAGNVLQYGGNQAWSVGSEIAVAAPAPGVSANLPGGGAELVFGDTNGAPYTGYELWIDDAGDLRVRIMSSFLGGSYIDVAGNTDVADGKMHFIGASYDGSGTAAGVTLYVDGVADKGTVLSDTLAGSAVSNGPLIIGNQLNGWQNQFQLGGQMFNFELSDTARAAAYFQAGNAGMPQIDGSTALAYEFASGSGGSVADLSGNNHTGSVSNPLMWQQS